MSVALDCWGNAVDDVLELTGVLEVEHVRVAVLEESGGISVIARPPGDRPR